MQLIEQVNSLQEVATEVAEVNSAPIIEQPAIFDLDLVMQRNGFVAQYIAKVQQVARFTDDVVVKQVPEVVNTSRVPKPF